MKDPLTITREECAELFKLLFPKTHSDGFMEAEIKDILNDPDYRFLERPNEGYITITESFLFEYGYDLPDGLYKALR